MQTSETRDNGLAQGRTKGRNMVGDETIATLHGLIRKQK